MSKHSFFSQNASFQNTSLISVISIAIKQNVSYLTHPFEILKEQLNNYIGLPAITPYES
jgi:hypothetical protein